MLRRRGSAWPKARRDGARRGALGNKGCEVAICGGEAGEQGSGCRAGLHPGEMGNPRGVQEVVTGGDRLTWAGQEAGRPGGCCNQGQRLLSQLTAHAPPALAPISSVKPAKGIGKGLSGAGWEGEDTPSFLLVTGSSFQHIFPALVMTEVAVPPPAPG